MALIVGFLGRAGSGKTTASRHLQDNYGFSGFSFAGPVKSLAQDLFDLSSEQVAGTQQQKAAVDPRYGKTPRQLMQTLGDKAREYLGEHIWMDACVNRIEDSGVALACVDDVRYLNEAVLIHEGGYARRHRGIIIKLICVGDTHTDTHASETSVDEVSPYLIDVEIFSSRSPGSVLLKRELDKALERLGIRK